MSVADVQGVIPALNWGSVVPSRQWDGLTASQRNQIVLELENRGLTVRRSVDEQGMRVVKVNPSRAERFAEMDVEHFIPRSAWTSLGEEEKHQATELLRVRGLSPYPTFNSMRNCESVCLIPLGSSSHPVRLYSVNPSEFTFVSHMGDRRVEDREEIEIKILNCRSEHEAAEKLTRWLASLAKLGSSVEAEAEAPPFEIADAA